MKKTFLLCAALIFTLAGCTSMHHDRSFGPRVAPVVGQPGDHFIQVVVIDGVFVNNESLLVLGRAIGVGPTKIYWYVDPTKTPYRFDISNGIVPVTGKDQITGCAPFYTDLTIFVCDNAHTVAGTFKYTINLLKLSIDPQPIHLDPLIVND